MTLEHLRAYMGKLGKRGLEEEYMKLRNIQPEGSFTNSVVPYNIGKNRYRDVLTFDHSRVKLRTINIEVRDWTMDHGSCVSHGLLYEVHVNS